MNRTSIWRISLTALMVMPAARLPTWGAESFFQHLGDGPQWAEWDGVDEKGGWHLRDRTVVAPPDQPAQIQFDLDIGSAGHYRLWVQLRCTATVTLRDTQDGEIRVRQHVNPEYGQIGISWRWDKVAVYLHAGRYTLELSQPTVHPPYRDMEQHYTDVVVQDLILTDDLQFDPTRQSGAYQIQWKQRIRHDSALQEGGLYLWTCDMYGRLLSDKDIGHNLGQADGPDGRAHRFPVDEPRITELHIDAAINEREVNLLNITSVFSNAVDVTVNCPSALTGPTGQSFPDRVEVRVGGHLWGLYGGLSVAPMFTSKDLTTELLLDSPRYWPTGDWQWGPQSIPRNVFNYEAIRKFPQLKVPPFDTVQLFLLVNTYDVPAGKYESLVTLRLADGGRQRVMLKVNVLPVELPVDSGLVVQPYSQINACRSKDPAVYGKWAELMLDYGANCMFMEDFSDPGIFALAGRLGMHNYSFIGTEPMSTYLELDDAKLANHLQAIVDRHAAVGMDYGRWCLTLSDETWLTGLKPIASRIKKLFPEIRLESNPPLGTVENSFEPMEGLIDVWVPNITIMKNERLLEYLKDHQKQGGTFYFYAVYGWADTKRESAGALHRNLWWTAYQWGADGFGVWTWLGGHGQVGDLWDDMDPTTVDAALVLPGPDGMIVTRNLQAFREGMDDYRMLKLLDRAAETAAERGDAKRAGKVQSFLQHVTAGEGATGVYRDEMLQMLGSVKDLLSGNRSSAPAVHRGNPE